MGNKIPLADQNQIGEGTPINKPTMEVDTNEFKIRDGMSSQTSAEEVATAGGHGGGPVPPLHVASDQQQKKSSVGENAGHGWNFNDRNVRVDPFAKNTRMNRSPPREIASNVAKGCAADDQGQKGLKRRLNLLMEKISELKEFVDSKPNIHLQVKKMIVGVKKAASDAMDEARDANWGVARDAIPREVVSTQTQTLSTETPRPVNTPVRTVNADRGAKRGRDKEGEKKERPAKQLRLDETDNEGTPKTSRKAKAPQRRTGDGKKMPRRPRADAILVEKSGEATYADILRMMKNDPNLKEVSEKVARIKRTQKGQMMLELKKGEDGRSDDMREAVGKALGSSATVRVLTQEVNIVCRDMDEVTTKEEVLSALEKEFGWSSLPPTAIRSMRPSYGDTQTAIISLPFEQAKKALSAGKVKIGWTVCRLREAVRPKMCFRCLDFGHMARDCKNEDRSKLCRRCGVEGHIAKNCGKDPRCMLCKDGDKSRPHVTGSSRCPRFRSSTKPA